jgi:hypothetical protein
MIPTEDDLYLLEDDRLTRLVKGGVEFEIPPMRAWSPCPPILIGGTAYFVDTCGKLYVRGVSNPTTFEDQNLIELVVASK